MNCYITRASDSCHEDAFSCTSTLSFNFDRNVIDFIAHRMILVLLKGKRGNNRYDAQKIMLKNIKRSVSSTATRFSGYSQHVSC